jgi:hypothetical protein
MRSGANILKKNINFIHYSNIYIMLQNCYYIVTTYFKFNGLKYPLFTTCALTNGKFFRIENLSEYLQNGEGITNDEIISEEFKSVIDNHFEI